MNYVSINDKRKKRVVQLLIGSDNVLRMDYFKRTFPDATTIIFQDNELNQYISIPSDESGHFRFDWDPTVVYELVYRDESSNRSISPSSSTSRIWNLLTIAGSLFKSTTTTSHYKKTK
ncbi:unnamed protein product [Rotaria magnacalcarata]|uniref:Uncharacterized protein n=1 Tax=Rotaria magnacalcarata TaxID=392030 RepID=A0A816LG62_9BILA|nr:unnamed protein product [Rotaria magnacalcarata]CAF1966659.1 unnamed protein product [Rotaria magnacalcarata]